MKMQIGFRVFVREDGSYRHLTIRVQQFKRCDALKEYRDAPSTSADYYHKRCQAVRRVTGGTAYLERPCGGEGDTELEWQANRNRDDRDWYGMGVNLFRAEAQDLKLTNKVVRAIEEQFHFNGDPRKVVGLLREKLKAIPIKYVDLEDRLGTVWIEDEDFDLDQAIPLPERETEAVA